MISRLDEYEAIPLLLIYSKELLEERIKKDIQQGIRKEDVLKRSCD